MDNIYSAYHYACKTKADKEAVEQIYEEVKKSAQTAIYRNIGDIFFTARTDTEINGAVECNGGTYSTADFEGKQNVGNLLASGSLPYVSLSEYESLVSANGSCRAFGWDGGTEFRVPTIPALLLTKEQSAVVGNGMALGMTDGINSGSAYGYHNGSGQVAISTQFGVNVGTSLNADLTSVSRKAVGVTTDPTKSGIVANLDVIEYRAMVQLASGATDQAVITATSALQQLANKVDKTSATDRETVVGWGMPDYSAEVSLPTSTTEQSYTCAKKGRIDYFLGYDNNSPAYIKINSTTLMSTTVSSGYPRLLCGCVDVEVGDIIKYKIGTTSTTSKVNFYPLKGVN